MRKVFMFLLVLVLAWSSLAYSNPSSNWQTNQPTFDKLYAGDFESYWPILSGMKDGQCEATTDFIIGIPPGGCSPSVVRSDLLAEQNVPVFCELYAIKINPLIKVSSIKSISFKGDYPEGVRSIVYHPARAAVKSYSTLVGTPTLENIGYVVIILDQEKVEANIPEEIFGNLTATMRYDIEEAYGTGKGEYYLEPVGDDYWQTHYMENAFWNGRGFLRVSDVGSGQAKIQVMGSKDKILRSLTLKEGETSTSSYLPGFYCKAGLKLKLTDITTQEDMARLNIDGNDIWVRKGSKFLDGKCSVTSLNVRNNNDGDISISCSGAGNIGTLSLKGKGVFFKDGKDGEKKYNTWEKVGDKYLFDFGTFSDKDRDLVTDYVILASKDPKSSSNKKDVDSWRKEILNAKNIDSFDEFEKNIDVVNGLDVVKKGEDDFIRLDGESEDKKANEFFDKSVKVVRDELVKYYGSEEKEIGGTWAEEALLEEIELAGELGQFTTKKSLIDLFLDKYPLAETADHVRDMRAKMDVTDYSESYVSAYVGDEFVSISVVDFKAIGEGEKMVDLRVGNTKFYGYNESNKGDFNDNEFEVLDISPGSVKLRFTSGDKDVATKSPPAIKEGESYDFNGRTIYVDEIHVNQVAHVSLIPDVKNEKSEADFSFRIGVEKRAIELSPEKAQNMINNLDESIEKWENIVEKLGNVVSGFKGACFATSAVLMVKSMVSGVDGEAAARGKVMSEYRKKCDTDSKYRDMTRTQCYNELNKDGSIDNAVESMAGYLEGVNADMKSCQSVPGVVDDSGGIFGGKSVVDDVGYRKCLAEKIGDSNVIIDVGGEQKNVKISGDLSLTQLQSIMLWKKSEGIGKEAAKNEMDAALRYVALSQEDESIKASIEKSFEFNNVKFPVSVLKEGSGAVYNGGLKISKSDIEGVVSNYEDLNLNEVGDDEIIGAQIVHSGSSDYLYLFEADSGSQLGIYKVAKNGGELDIIDVDGKSKLDKIPESKGIALSLYDAGSCSNNWKSKAQVQYYEIGDNAGLPAIVPFGYPGKSLEGGWYAWVSNSKGEIGSDSIQGYKASGDVNNFYICNIGVNGLMESRGGDDDCLNFYENSISQSKEFQLCKNIDMAKLYDRAREAIKQASIQAGESSVNILGESVERGRPVNMPSVECQDFMSPEDCLLMFNVCDPVICPASRCDFGGKFPVSDVIQTGIIGSLTLCLPNAKEGIKVPICLSGVHAGLDSYLSILKSERECLQHSIDSGELVGICDQISSIYKCEFFWRQASPLMDYMIPGIIDYAVGGNRVRGGGEYSLVTDAWENTKNSISYFKNTYAQNAFKAFDIRSTQEIGSSFCKAFIGTSVPGSANFIEDLLKPESPSQFYAQFSEQLFSEATVPSTSQYKVYYHIYAGNDQGVQYKVYLKNPPQTSYYNSNPEVTVKSGFIAAGSSADESIDFTAPSGYKELCVVINAKEECGFKQVTTDFGLDFISKKFVEEQATDTDIRTEKECIAGNPSALSMATLNLQAGAEEVASPDIALRGIVRVCASENPDAGVVRGNYVTCSNNGEQDVCSKGFACDGTRCFDEDTNTFETTRGRWKDVGYCGDVSLRCWLDVDSVKDDLGAIEDINGSSISVLDGQRGLIENGKCDLICVAAVLAKARQDIGGLLPGDLVGSIKNNVLEGKPKEIVDALDRVIGTDNLAGAGTNNDRAEALSLKASVLRLLSGNVEERRVEKPEEPVTRIVVDEVVEDGEKDDTKTVEEEEIQEEVAEQMENIEEIKNHIVEFEGEETFVYEVDGTKHIGIGHKITAESRDIFSNLFGCDDNCFDEIIAGERSLTDTQVDELFDHDIRVYVDRTKLLFPSYGGYPDYVKIALVSSVYRGEMESGHKTVVLINEGRWREAAVEYINRQDYREAEAKGLSGIVDRMNANRDSFLKYAVELGK